MKILGLDTSTLDAGLALVEGDRILEQVDIPRGETHSLTLLPALAGLLDRAGLAARDLDLMACGIGPGSFTGLRIGLSAAKGVAWGAGIPLVGVPSLTALAAAYPVEAGRICPVIDARKNQVFAAFYQAGPKGEWIRSGDIEAWDPENLGRALDGPTTFFGEGLGKWEEKIRAAAGPLFLRGDPAYDRISASAVAFQGKKLWAAGAESDPALVAPLYIRPPDIREPKPVFQD